MLTLSAVEQAALVRAGEVSARELVEASPEAIERHVGGLRAEAGVTDDAVRFSALLRIWNVTGQPAISLPLHASIWRYRGDPDDLLHSYDAMLAEVRASTMSLHLCLRDRDGIVVVDTCPSRNDFPVHAAFGGGVRLI